MIQTWLLIKHYLQLVGLYLAPIGIRVLLAWEFYESGLVKLNGSNWFASIQDEFLFPFNIVPVAASWLVATWAELIGGVALLLGVATRLFAATLLVLTVVATAAVHWPDSWNTVGELLQGYSVRDKGFGNYKLPALFFVMLLPLIFQGPGRLSIDWLVVRMLDARGSTRHQALPSVA